MKNIFIAFCLLFFTQSVLTAQPIILDNSFEDWAQLSKLVDDDNDGAALDFIELSVYDTEDKLYFYVKTKQEIKFYDSSYSGTSIELYIDTDDDSSTGNFGNGIGAELEFFFGRRDFNVYYPGVASWDRNPNEINFNILPSTTGSEFEFSISKDYMPFNQIQVFNDNTIRYYFRSSTGDFIPNTPTSYQMQNAADETLPLSLERSTDNLRLVSYNTLNEGLDDIDRIDNFKRIITALAPDVVTFNESDVSANYAKNLFEDWMGGDWYAMAFDNSRNLTVSRYPIVEEYSLSSRTIAALIDLPNQLFDTDFLSINFHAPCCDNDSWRQDECDRIISFVREIKEGDYPELTNGLPYAISGDFNFVGFDRQLETLLTGDIADQSQFGSDITPDWNDSDLSNVYAKHPNSLETYTWINPFSSWPPGKLDFILTSNSVAKTRNAFVLRTDDLTQTDLIDFNLQIDDTNDASDHLPVVADLELLDFISVSNSNIAQLDFEVKYDQNLITIENPNAMELKNMQMHIIDVMGRQIGHYPIQYNVQQVSFGQAPAGIYYLNFSNGYQFNTVAIVRH